MPTTICDGIGANALRSASKTSVSPSCCSAKDSMDRFTMHASHSDVVDDHAAFYDIPQLPNEVMTAPTRDRQGSGCRHQWSIDCRLISLWVLAEPLGSTCFVS